LIFQRKERQGLNSLRPLRFGEFDGEATIGIDDQSGWSDGLFDV
jgi:hypothetical protein